MFSAVILLIGIVPLLIGIKIEGLPQSVKTGSFWNITCVIFCIKPEAKGIYFTINGERCTGSINTVNNNDDHGSLTQSTTIWHG